MSCSPETKSLFAASRKTVAYVEVYPDLAKQAIKAYLIEKVPALSTGSFCPEGHRYNDQRMCEPVVSMILGGPRYNGDRISIDGHWIEWAIHPPYPDDMTYDVTSDTWTLLIDTTWWTDGIGSPRAMKHEKVGVPIPGDVVRDLFSLMRGEHEEVTVVWSW